MVTSDEVTLLQSRASSYGKQTTMEVKKILKDKKFWFASFLIAWAAALQGHMMWLQRQEAFKQKFGNLDQDNVEEKSI